MSETPERYPLAWPSHRPRRKPSQRVRGSFVHGGRAITAAAASEKLEAEISRLGGKYPLLSSNLELRKDGRPRIDRGSPADPGVCVYFLLKGEPMAMACDTFTEVSQNIAAIANDIDAVRRRERYGVATAAESLQAFSALPPPTAKTARAWHDILGLRPGERSREAIDAAYRKAAREAHPDAGGSTDAMATLNAARDAALRSLA